MRWDHQADNEILCILLRLLQEQGIAIPYADIAAQFGHGITLASLKHRIQRIQRSKYTNKAEEIQGEVGGVEGISSPHDTPAKPPTKRVKRVEKAKMAKKPQVEKAVGHQVEKSSG
ncbi:hypothetical protein BGX38DRAFT_1272729 [Terfezia claveryi]|nr:hypothetical protein BGX38DRAFT_1272729 [Terfezia claveryi]